MSGLFDLLNDLDNQTSEPEKERILRAPFGYPGGKSRSIANILPLLPIRHTYVEPFGGSAAVLLARPKCRLEVYNDRYGGVTSFYRCIREKDKLDRLYDRLALTVHSREEWCWCKETWKNVEDDVERAARWYYMTIYSFSSLGRNFGRATKGGTLAGRIQTKIKDFPLIHERFMRVQVENLDYYNLMKDYDSRETVFYCDPPYVDAFRGTFKHEMGISEHKKFLDLVFHMKGFVAVSGYSNPLYDNQDWDSKHSWESYVSASPRAFCEGNHKIKRDCVDKRVHSEEVLWIKEARR